MKTNTFLYWALAFFCAVFAGTSASQNTLDNPDWTEDQPTKPPAYSTSKLIPIEMPPYVSLKVGVDPETVAVGADGVVRYVVVMSNASGNVSVAYEGIRCVSGEVKTYARGGSSGDWVQVTNPQWKAMNDNMPSKHAYAIARQGACEARISISTAEVLKALKRQSKPKKADLGI